MVQIEQLNIFHFLKYENIKNGDFVKFYIRSSGHIRNGEIIEEGYGYVDDRFILFKDYYRRHVYCKRKVGNGPYETIVFTPLTTDIEIMNYLSESERNKLIKKRIRVS